MAASNGLKKSQRRRANERRRKEADKLLEETLGPMPEHIKELFASTEPNIPDHPTPREQLEPWERAPSYLLKYDEEYGEWIEVDQEAQAHVTQKASESRTAERDHKISELRLKYRNHWGKRGRAKFIARCETDEDKDNPLSERTVQKYFKITKT